jgi:hypothetical protein
MRAKIQTIVLGRVHSGMAIGAKQIAAHPRHRLNCLDCLRGYEQYGDLYPQRILFIAGLPKSGTTWLKKMLCCFPGFHELMIPELATYEKRTGGSHDFQLPERVFDRLGRMLVLMKLHVDGSPHNVSVLRKAGLRHVILHRDLRDVAVSYYFYVARTPWHPEHGLYSRMKLQDGLRTFAGRSLMAYMDWVRSWRDNRDPEQSIELRYETMLEDTRGTILQVADFFRLNADDAKIDEILEKTAFQQLSHGREQGEDPGGRTSSFYRKGVAGDWANQFDARTKALYKSILGDFLIEFGYEKNKQW